MNHDYKLSDIKRERVECDTVTDVNERVVSFNLSNLEEMPNIIVERVEKNINRIISAHEQKEGVVIPLEDMEMGFYINLDKQEHELYISGFIGYSIYREWLEFKDVISPDDEQYLEIKNYYFELLNVYIEDVLKNLRDCA